MVEYFQERIMIALDFTRVEQAEFFLNHWNGRKKPLIKIGYALFFAAGPQWIYERKKEGYSVFLDLKLHDIPQTVAKAMKSIGQLEVDFVTLHASGGPHMIEAARETVDRCSGQTKLLVVTQLTSIDQQLLNDQIGIPGGMEECVLRYAQQAQRAGADGVVCSGREVGQVKSAVQGSFLTVVPGIRWGKESTQDQKRVVTPRDAIKAGADYLVIGRPITQSVSPVEVYDEIISQIEQARSCVL